MKIAIYNLHFATLGGGERRTAALAAHLSRTHPVTLFVTVPHVSQVVAEAFGLDLSAVDIVLLARDDHFDAIARSSADLFINNSFNSDLACPARQGIYMCMCPGPVPAGLPTYGIVTANSHFTARWIEQRWSRRAEVVYSACASMGPPAAKTKSILAVGRFAADLPIAHNKRQEVLVRAFRALGREMADGWSLRLIGNVGPSEADRAFVEDLRRAGEGYPVTISTGVAIDELRRAYRHAAIYWHAAGHGTDAEREPQRQEHFGMSIVEAMSAGAVPLVFDSGGPREIVRSGENGFRWTSEAELIEKSRMLIRRRDLLQAMGARAADDSKQFDGAHFLERMDAIIDRLSPRAA